MYGNPPLLERALYRRIFDIASLHMSSTIPAIDCDGLFLLTDYQSASLHSLNRIVFGCHRG
jgi:hypothetical protein